MGVDLAGYRRRTSPLLARWLCERLEAVEAERRARLAGVERLASLPSATPAVRDGGRGDEPLCPLFRVPLLVHDRDDVVVALGRRGVVVGYVYDPPLDDYAGPRFMDPSPSPEAARCFARHTLPTDPLDATRIARSLDRIGAETAHRRTDEPGPPPRASASGREPGDRWASSWWRWDRGSSIPPASCRGVAAPALVSTLIIAHPRDNIVRLAQGRERRLGNSG